MKGKVYVYLFRHGQTTYNRDKRFTGWNNPPLTAKGVVQAKILAKKLKNKKIQVAIHTHLRRSKKTLQEVLKYHPECTVLKKDDRMIERNYGELNGTLHDSYIKEYGQELFDAIHRGYNTPPPKGESFAMVEKRVRIFIKDLIKLMKKKKVSVAISAHGNSIRLFRKIMENASVKQAVAWKIPYDKVFTYSIKV